MVFIELASLVITYKKQEGCLHFLFSAYFSFQHCSTLSIWKDMDFASRYYSNILYIDVNCGQWIIIGYEKNVPCIVSSFFVSFWAGYVEKGDLEWSFS